MSAMLNSWGGAWAGYFGPAVIQHTVFLCIILLGVYLARNAKAGLRYSICFAGMAKLLVPPFLPAGFMASMGLFAGPGSGTAASRIVTLSGPGTATGPSGAFAPASGSGLGLGGTLLVVWVAVVAFLSVRAAARYLGLRRELASAVPVAGYPDGCSSGGSEVAIMKTPAIPVAMTFGLVHPRIYVPEAWDRWSEDWRRMVIAHELAHLSPGDRWGKTLQGLARVLYFFHPLVWLLDRRMDRYREMMCDDAVIEKSPGGGDEYSRCLVSIAEEVLRGSVSLSTGSAFLRHESGLMDRVRYQLEVGKMRSMSARVRTLILAGLLVCVLPLSWYCGNAETRQSAEEKAARAGEVSGAEPAAPVKEVKLVVVSENEATLDGKDFSLDDLPEALASRFPADRGRVVIRLSCGADVPMETISEIHRILVDNDFLKVIYEGDLEKGLPLVLPTPDLQKKLRTIADEHALDVRVNVPGFVEVDGKRIKITELKDAVTAKLAEDPYMVVSLSWSPLASYDDFLLALAQVKAGGAQRIAVEVGKGS